MRIGLLTTSFPRTLEGDVPGAFVLGFARSLARLGHGVEVLAPEPGEARFANAPAFPDLSVKWVPYLRPRVLQRTFYGAGVMDNLRRDPRAALGLLPFVLSLTQALRNHVGSWDALVSHWALPCALVAGQWRQKRPHLAMLHSADVFLLERLPGRGELAKRIIRGADALVFSSRDLRSRFSALLSPLERSDAAGHMHVCAMGIEPALPPVTGQARARLREELGLRGFSVLSLGRLIPIKGLEHAVEAVAGMADTELVIAGAGPTRAALEAQARHLNAPVRFIGEVHGQAKHEWLCACDAFVLPSVRLESGRSEGMPTTLLEAMQYGLSVVASDVGGVRDVVEDGENGLLVPPGQSQPLARALQGLRGAAATREKLGAAARETAALYEWDVLGPRFAELLVSSA